MLHDGLRRELLDFTGTAAYLRVDANDGRIHPLVIPQKKPGAKLQVPALVYTVTACDRQVTYCGTSGLVRTTMRLDCYASKYGEARELAAAVRSCLLDFSGMLGSSDPDVEVDVRHASLETEFDVQDFEPGLYRVSQSWNFWHTE